MATNLVRDEARKDARRRRRLELLAQEERDRQDTVPQVVSMENAENAALARRALEALTERDREALLMREEGLDYNEIAAALELSVASVGTTLARARKRLVEAFETLERSGRKHAAS